MNELFASITGIGRTLNNTVDKISTLANGAMCFSSIVMDLLRNPAALLGNLKDIILGLISTQLANLEGLIDQEINFIVGTVEAYIGLLKQLLSITDLIKNLLLGLEVRIEALLKLNFDSQNCAAQSANFARCVQAQINSMVTNKVAASINGGLKSIGAVNLDIQNNFLKTSNLFEDYANKSALAVNKANIQLVVVNKKIPY